MNLPIALALVAGAAIGALWGWRSGTLTLRYSPELYEGPVGVSHREYVRNARARLRRRRLVLTASGAVAGAAVVLALLLVVAVWLRR